MSNPWWCECCVWVEAKPCKPAAVPEGMRVFVHEDDLPSPTAERVFKFGTEKDDADEALCWRVDPCNARTLYPNEPDAFRVIPGADGASVYGDCAACEADDPAPPSPGEPGNPDRGGGGGFPLGPDDGPGGGGPTIEPETDGVHLSVCPSHAVFPGVVTDYWVPCSQAPQQTAYVRINGICYEVPPASQCALIPPDARRMWFRGSYRDCATCTSGAKAVPCPGQEGRPGFAGLPDIWVRQDDLPAETIVFEYRTFCFELDPGNLGTVPPGVFVFKPRAFGQTLANCGECGQGFRAELCPDQIDPTQASELWVKAEDLPAGLLPGQDWVYFRYQGLCYRAPRQGLVGIRLQRLPPSATLVIPADEYDDCATCLCGERADRGEPGFKAQLCAQPDGNIAAGEDVWVRASDMPDPLPVSPVVFLRGETCYWVDPTQPVREIPAGGLLDDLRFQYSNCRDCADRGGMRPPVGGGGFEGEPWDCDQVPKPPWCDLPEVDVFYMIREVAGHQEYWLRQNRVCALWGVVPCDIRGTFWRILPLGIGPEACYEVVGEPSPAPLGPVADNWITGGPFSSAVACKCDTGLSCLKITGYADQMFDATHCGLADDSPAPGTAWDGKLYLEFSAGVVCLYSSSSDLNPNPPDYAVFDDDGNPIDNVPLIGADIAKISYETDPPPGIYVLRIGGRSSGGGSDVPVWVGTKSAEGGPVGTYNRSSGCAPTWRP